MTAKASGAGDDRAHVDATAIDALFAPYDRTDAPGFAVGIALGGVPRYRRGFGMASVELPVALSPTIRMRIGSTSKHFCVLAVMLLAEAGLLSIEDSPRQYLPELPDWADAMTLRQLMAHTSGMRDSLDLILHAAGPGRPASPDFQLQALARLDSVNFAPGASWNYNNGGYVLLTEIVTRVSGVPFADFLRERILEPIGMYDTLLRPLDTELLPNSATLHVPSPTGGYMRGVFGAPIGGEGGIVSTVDDMLLWLRHMSAPTVGPAESWAAMRTPMATHGYGLGLTMGRHRGLSTVHHAGAVVGGSSQMMKVLDPELDIIVMSNGRSSLELHRLVDAIIDRCVPALPHEPENIAAPSITGTFFSAATGTKLSLEAVDGAQAVRIGGMSLPARRDAEGALSLPLIPSDMRIVPDEAGEMLEVTEFGRTDRLHRVEPPADPGAARLAGAYESAAAAIAAVVDMGSAARMTLSNTLGSLDYALEPIGSALWEARATGILPLAATLELRDDGFFLTTGRTMRLWFARTA